MWALMILLLFCFALNKSMILERNCAISLVVHFEESLVSWSWNYQFIVGFTASLGIKIISKEKMINIKRSKCSWKVCYPTNDFEWYQFKPWNLESKLHFGTWLSDDEFDNMIYQIVSKLFYEVNPIRGI